MLKNLPSNTTVNLLLGFVIVVLSFYTITWQHKNYLLYKQHKVAQQKNQQIMALHKQLLNEQETRMSSAEIKNRALKTLKMQPPSSNKIRQIVL